jgi:hypothetical protein
MRAPRGRGLAYTAAGRLIFKLWKLLSNERLLPHNPERPDPAVGCAPERRDQAGPLGQGRGNLSQPVARLSGDFGALTPTGRSPGAGPLCPRHGRKPALAAHSMGGLYCV